MSVVRRRQPVKSWTQLIVRALVGAVISAALAAVVLGALYGLAQLASYTALAGLAIGAVLLAAFFFIVSKGWTK
jgi:Na+-transporting NADH:ubiquinone oxidoreductase subunit NqrB